MMAIRYEAPNVAEEGQLYGRTRDHTL